MKYQTVVLIPDNVLGGHIGWKSIANVNSPTLDLIELLGSAMDDYYVSKVETHVMARKTSIYMLPV